ncbi:MAG: oligosaccharide flippase family protein [Pyrinomonadaceae bacterium]
MLRQVVNQSAIYLASIVISRAVNLVLLAFYARVFKPEDFGTYDLLVAAMMFCNIAITLEVSQGVARFFPNAPTTAEKRSYATTGLWFTILTYTLFSSLLWFFATPLADMLVEDEKRENVLRAAAFSFWSNGLFYFLQNQLRWELKPLRYAVASLVFTLLSGGLAVALIIIAGWGVESLFYGSFIGGLIASLLAYWFVRESFNLNFDGSKLRRMISFSTPLALSAMATITSLYADRIVIKELMSLSDVGLYGVAYRFAAIAGLLLVGFQGTITPMVTAHQHQQALQRDLGRLIEYFSIAALSTVFVLAVFSREIFELATSPEYHSAHSLLAILAAATLLSGMYVFTPGLWLAARTKLILSVSVLTAVLNLLANLTLVPKFGLLGAALALLASATVHFCLYAALGQRFYPLPTNWRRIGAATALCAIMILAGQQIQLQSITSVTFKAAYCAIGVIILASLIIQKQVMLAEIGRRRRNGT